MRPPSSLYCGFLFLSAFLAAAPVCAEDIGPAHAAMPVGSSVFTDTPSVTYTPNYVAPPAKPQIYTDPETGAYCREYSQQISVNGHVQEDYGTACLQQDGSWRVTD